jgi:hypothetical protein
VHAERAAVRGARVRERKRAHEQVIERERVVHEQRGWRLARHAAPAVPRRPVVHAGAALERPGGRGRPVVCAGLRKLAVRGERG